MGITADDLWPLVSKLSPEERIRLVRLTLARAVVSVADAEAYRQVPVGQDEFRQDGGEDALAWDAEGWEEFT